MAVTNMGNILADVFTTVVLICSAGCCRCLSFKRQLREFQHTTGSKHMEHVQACLLSAHHGRPDLLLCTVCCVLLQVAELQEAAEGVPAWEQQLARQPAGQDLVLNIAALHKARYRLVWLQQQGMEGRYKSALAVLGQTAKKFQRQHPEYPGENVFVEDH